MKSLKLVRNLGAVAAIAGGLFFGGMTADAAEQRPAAASASRPASGARVDINSASQSALEALPGVGPEIAKEITAHRPYASIDDLERVQGIGGVRLQEMRPHVMASNIDLNTASRATLEKLPGVGPVIAAEIVQERPFASVAELEKVRGIGPAKMDELRDYVTVSRSASARRVNINTASKAELESLPEVGPVKAAAIIKARPFRAPEDVKRVAGIGDETFDEIKDHIAVR